MGQDTHIVESAHAEPRRPLREAVFEDRYGEGAVARITTLLRMPCVTFADIAREFGVTRERVRQWHLAFLPGAPRGHARRRLCLQQQARKRLASDPLFRSFYAQARHQLKDLRLSTVTRRSRANRTVVRVGACLVALVDAHGRDVEDAQLREYARASGRVDFLYVRLADEHVLWPVSPVARRTPRAGDDDPLGFSRLVAADARLADRRARVRAGDDVDAPTS